MSTKPNRRHRTKAQERLAMIKNPQPTQLKPINVPSCHPPSATRSSFSHLVSSSSSSSSALGYSSPQTFTSSSLPPFINDHTALSPLNSQSNPDLEDSFSFSASSFEGYLPRTSSSFPSPPSVPGTEAIRDLRPESQASDAPWQNPLVELSSVKAMFRQLDNLNTQPALSAGYGSYHFVHGTSTLPSNVTYQDHASSFLKSFFDESPFRRYELQDVEYEVGFDVQFICPENWIAVMRVPDAKWRELQTNGTVVPQLSFNSEVSYAIDDYLDAAGKVYEEFVERTTAREREMKAERIGYENSAQYLEDQSRAYNKVHKRAKYEYSQRDRDQRYYKLHTNVLASPANPTFFAQVVLPRLRFGQPN